VIVLSRAGRGEKEKKEKKGEGTDWHSYPFNALTLITKGGRCLEPVAIVRRGKRGK